MQSVALFLALRPKLYAVFFGSVPCQPPDFKVLVKTKPLLPQPILQLGREIAGFFIPLFFRLWDFIARRRVFDIVAASRECTVERMNVFPLRGRSSPSSSMCGNDKGEQQARGNQGFHGGLSFLLTGV